MLASLLPGLRELRTPLAIGYLYTLALYVLIGDSIPTKAEAGQHIKPLYDVAHWLGKPTALAASAFLAYVMGCVLQVSTVTIIRWAQPPAKKLLRGGLARHVGALTSQLSRSASDRLLQYRAQRIASTKWRPPTDADANAAFDQGFDRLLRDLPQLPTRLYTASKDMYGDYDRLMAEADLRVNVGFASTFLSCVIATQVHVLWTLLSIPILVLTYRGIATLRKANDILVQAIVTDLVKAPSFEEYLSELGVRPNDRSDPGYR